MAKSQGLSKSLNSSYEIINANHSKKQMKNILDNSGGGIVKADTVINSDRPNNNNK